MKNFAKTVLVVVSLLLSVGLGFAADVKKPLADIAGAAKSSGDVVKTDSKTAAKAKLVDINTAAEAELKAIPGIGDAYAAKIIAGRPYANKTQLKSRKVLPGNIYEQVKDMIIAKLLKK